MNSTQIQNRMKGILNIIEAHMIDAGMTVERSKSDANPDIDVLISEFKAGLNSEPVLSSIFFLPPEKALGTEENEIETDMLYLVQSLLIRDDIEDDDMRITMLQAIAYINFHLPYGTFVMDDALESVTFRNVMHIYEALDDTDTSLYVLRETISAINILSLYISAINGLIDKAISWDEFIEIVDAYTAKH